MMYGAGCLSPFFQEELNPTSLPHFLSLLSLLALALKLEVRGFAMGRCQQRLCVAGAVAPVPCCVSEGAPGVFFLGGGKPAHSLECSFPQAPPVPA